MQVLVLALLLLIGLPANSQTMCGAGNDCKPSSEHSISMLHVTSSGGPTESWTETLDLAGAAARACDLMKQHYDNATEYITFTAACMPRLPLVNYGGTFAGIPVIAPYIVTRRVDSVVTYTSTADQNLLTSNCYDSFNPNLPAVGPNGKCYCKAGFDWRNELKACMKVMDIYKAPPCDNCEKRVGHPIVPLVGAKVLTVPLGIELAGRPLTLHYDTRSWVQYATPPSMVNDSRGMAVEALAAFGASWTSSAHKSLSIQRPQGSISTGFVVHAHRGNGQFLSFTHPSTTVYTPANPTVRDELIPQISNDGFQTSVLRYVSRDGTVETYDIGIYTQSSGGTLLDIVYPDGKKVEYAYYSSGKLAGLLRRIQDTQSGRTVYFNYEWDMATMRRARVQSIIGPDARVISFGYNSNEQLTTITWPDTKVRTFLYERADLPWAVTGEMDENNSRYATYTYDQEGRAIGTELAGGVDAYSVTYGTPPQMMVNEWVDGSVLWREHYWAVPQGVSLTTPGGVGVTLNSTSVGGAPMLTSETQPAGSGSLESGKAISYDGAGNVASRDDAHGSRTCYAYDASNKETVRVEGLATSVACSTVTPSNATLPAGARKITTTWHPDWRKPAVVTEPLKKTTIVHHGQPDPFNSNAAASCTSAPQIRPGRPLPVVCKQVEQALLSNGMVDSSVAARTTQLAYDSAARVTSTVDPKNQTTTFTYHPSTAYTGNGDPSFASVGLLLHADGSNGSTTFVDSSLDARTPTSVGTVSLSTSVKKWGSSSFAFTGAGAQVQYASNSAWNFGSGPFTVEFWWYLTDLAGDQVALTNYGGASTGWVISQNGGRIEANLSGDVADISATGALTANTWHHIKLAGQAGSIKLYVNEVQVGSTYTGAVAMDTSAPMTMGGLLISGTWYIRVKGYIDDVRITKGVARPPAGVPSQAFADSGADITALGQSLGDLYTMTNAAGHVTTYNKYDPAGRVRQVTDAKGVVTDVTYNTRGLVSTVAVTPPGMSARTTTYTYNDLGLLTTAALQDGTSLTYSYDAAHRLVGAADTRGNTVTYTLDVAGNRTAEELRDSSGTLRQSIARSFDALNRMQQVTGASR
jgi:YD repeat-containing protein